MKGRTKHADRDTQSCLLAQLRFFANEGTRNDLSFVPELSGQALGSLGCKLCGTSLIFHLIMLKEPFKIEVWAVWGRCFEEYGKQKFCTLNRTGTDWVALTIVLNKALTLPKCSGFELHYLCTGQHVVEQVKCF